jgi:tRNA threonylcarbamoyladenosine modification (KEOPS) complex Cgi121 subunit
MLHYLRDYNKYVEITGFRNVKFESAEAFLKANRKEESQNVGVQFFDAELIASWEHLYFAVLNALQAFKNKTNLSKTAAMETMLYASAQRQIEKAIQQCGIKPETTTMAVTLIGENPTQLKDMLESITRSVGAEPDEHVLELSSVKENRIKGAFQISDGEIKTVLKNENGKEALINLVVERVALLATQL